MKTPDVIPSAAAPVAGAAAATGFDQPSGQPFVPEKVLTGEERRFNAVFSERRKLAPRPEPEAAKRRAHGYRERDIPGSEPRDGEKALHLQQDILSPPNPLVPPCNAQGQVTAHAVAEKIDALAAASILRPWLEQTGADQQAGRDLLDQYDLEPGRSVSRGASDSDDDHCNDAAMLLQGPPIHTHAAGFAARQAQELQAQQAHEEKSRGALAGLINELVECLQISERMYANDWTIRLALKQNILPDTDLHLQNYGGRLSVRLVSRDPAAFRLMQENAEALCASLRADCHHDISVIAEQA